MTNSKIYIFALAATGSGISGSDRIFIEFARRWSAKFNIDIYLTSEGLAMTERNNLKGKNINFVVSPMNITSKLGFILNYFARIFEGVKIGLKIKLENNAKNIVYSSSEFWMDSLPCLILKIRHPKIKWVASWYQTAPNPLTGFSGGRYKLSAFYYWFMQQPIKPLISNFADFVLVNNDTEKKQFERLNNKGKAVVVLGAVDLDKIGKWKLAHGKSPKEFDAVFQGRFHPQKGVVELIEIWKKVVETLPNSKLAMIGDGPLMPDVKKQIAKYNLQKNIDLFGFLFDGDKKYKIFSQSKIVVHPAFYDSGGMASAEAMAFGIPCVGFDLPAYQTYYPKGIVKVKTGSIDLFAKEILRLLESSKRYDKLAKEAIYMIQTKWSWNNRANEILSIIV